MTGRNRRGKFIRSKAVWLSTALAVVAALVAASAARPGKGPQSQAAGQKTIVVGESSPIASNPNQQAITFGQQQVAKQLGWKLKTLDANLSPDKQVADIDTFISLKVAGITSWTLDPGAADAVYQRAAKAGIPIVGFNSESKFIETVVKQETDTACAPFKDAAAYIAKRIPGAKMFVIGGPPVPSIFLRVRCFTQAAKANGLKVVAKQDNVKDRAETAQPIVENMFTKHPDVQAIWTFNDPSALGAAAVVQSRGKKAWSGNTKGIIIIGNNGSKEAIDAIKAGAMTVTYDSNSTEAGAAAIRALAVHVKLGKPISAMPKTVVIKATRYDISNADKYVPPLKRKVKVGPIK